MAKEFQSSDVDEILKTFLFSQLSDSLVLVYRCVASLDYPILDKHSLKQQFEDRNDKEINRSAYQLILSKLQAVDFRLDTPQGTLEKISRRLDERFQGWQEKSNQVDQQLAGVLMTMAEMEAEADRINAYFQGWQEKANQVDQQLTAILRTLKDLGRVGVGGSDLGAS